jgi:hypothetical protein
VAVYKVPAVGSLRDGHVAIRSTGRRRRRGCGVPMQPLPDAVVDLFERKRL